jgi:hypothetical protein
MGVVNIVVIIVQVQNRSEGFQALIGIISPVIISDASEAKNLHILATSIGAGGSESLGTSFPFLSTDGGITPHSIIAGVEIRPGAIALMQILYCAQLYARLLVKLSIPAFAAE